MGHGLIRAYDEVRRKNAQAIGVEPYFHKIFFSRQNGFFRICRCKMPARAFCHLDCNRMCGYVFERDFPNEKDILNNLRAAIFFDLVFRINGFN
jgi:hypothetical protein